MELDKAQYIDDDEDTVYRLTSELQAEKKRLAESKDHLELDNNLQLANGKVDEMEKHYRMYHE